jgi:hypothetical protein
MRYFRSARWLLLALLLCAIPASSYAGVFISVGFAPPVLPVYVQPVCPEPGLLWTPGYWAYGDDGYYWVPGAWVPAPYVGALWTPGYWGWSGGMFVFHEGYWGPHVGYYGGVNYGFGYGGIGFAGGMWRGGVFAYNAAVVHVDMRDARFAHATYQDRMAVERGFVARDSHVAYSGGPGGIHHDPMPEERLAEHEQHVAKTSFQAQHESAARSDRTSYARSNGGHPQNLAAARPLPAETHAAPAARPMQPSRPAAQPGYGHGGAGMSAAPQARPAPQAQARPTPQSQPRPTPQAQSRPAPQAESHSAQPSHPASQQHSAPKAEPKEKERK